MAERRKLAAILAADVVGFSRLAGADEERTLARLRALRSDLIDPTVAIHHGRVVKRTGDGALIEFDSVVEAVRCAVEIQTSMVERNAGLAADRRIEFRIGIHLGDVVYESDGDLMGDGVNIAARLEGVAEPGAICLSEDAYRQVRTRLDMSVTDMGETALKNIAEPMRVYALQVGIDAAPGPTAAALATELALPDKPSIAVLPFTNMSGDIEQEYFADGIVEDIITALSRFKQLFVIARNSSFTYKGRSVDVKQVGRELGVRYVLEGSLRKAGNRVRITGQLIDASSGAHLWADRFDGDLEDIFELQDQITGKVVSVIAPRLEQAEIERAKQKATDSLDAYDHYLRGLAAFHQFTMEANATALGHFTQACELDPDFAAAYGMAARCYAQRKGFGWAFDAASEGARAIGLARRAAEIGRDDSNALSSAGFSLILFGEIDEGATFIERSLALNPNLVWTWNASAMAHALAGDAETAVAHAAKSLRLNPLDPMNFGVHTIAGTGYFLTGDYQQAMRSAETALHDRPNFQMAAALAAASAALAGRDADAAAAMRRLRQINPALDVASLADWLPFQHPMHVARWAEGLRKAGLPETA